MIVAARAGDGMALFAVPADAEGFERGRKLEKVGRKGQDTAELFFDDVAVPPEDVIGEVGRGLQLLMRNLPQERLSIAVTAVAARGAGAGDHARVRPRTATPSASRSAPSRPTASPWPRLRRRCRSRASTSTAACPAGRGRADAAEDAAGAKYWTTELQFKVIDLGLQLHGGYGYMEEYEIARMWRDARVQRIYGGTTEIMKEIVGRGLGL